MGLWNGSGISWTICKQSAPGSRQITTPTPHHSIFTGRVLFLTPNQQCQSTEDKLIREDTVQSICVCAGTCCQWYIRRSCFATTTYRKVRIAASVFQLIFQVGFEANISVAIDSVVTLSVLSAYVVRDIVNISWSVFSICLSCFITCTLLIRQQEGI